MTYKDAAHRLYMAEVERLKAQKQATNTFAAMVGRMENTVFHELYPPITAIDQGMFDDREESECMGEEARSENAAPFRGRRADGRGSASHESTAE
jgi:hypothetical protein